MSRIVVLDAAPVGLLCASLKRVGQPAIASRWLAALLKAGLRVILPEIADYEVRRELIRAGKTSSVARLDALATTIEYELIRWLAGAAVRDFAPKVSIASGGCPPLGCSGVQNGPGATAFTLAASGSKSFGSSSTAHSLPRNLTVKYSMQPATPSNG
jgi:hypothetical protein